MALVEAPVRAPVRAPVWDGVQGEGRFVTGCCRREGVPSALGSFRCPGCGRELGFAAVGTRGSAGVIVAWCPPDMAEKELAERWDEAWERAKPATRIG